MSRNQRASLAEAIKMMRNGVAVTNPKVADRLNASGLDRDEIESIIRRIERLTTKKRILWGA